MHGELLMEIRVLCEEAFRVNGAGKDIIMIPFTGETTGPYFNGKIIGTGVDTQTIGKDGSVTLSARYMLEGKDCAGNDCRIFIENTGNSEEGFTPRIVTDSPVLAGWEKEKMSASVEGIPGGVTVRICR